MSYNIESNNALQIGQLPVSVNIPPGTNFPEYFSQLYKRIARAVNTKEGSIYAIAEQGNYNQYYTLGSPIIFRPVYRRVFDMVNLNGGPITAGSTVTFAHGIVGPITQVATIYGGATNSDSPPKLISLPYVDCTLITNQIQIYATQTDIVLVNGSTQTSLTSASIVFEYMKN